MAIEFLNNSIEQNNDGVSLYNLAHIYLFEKEIERNIDKSIDLLIKSSILNFAPSKILLSIVLTKKMESLSLEKINEILSRYHGCKLDDLSNDVFEIVEENDLMNQSNYEKNLNSYQKIDFIYSFNKDPSVSPSF